MRVLGTLVLWLVLIGAMCSLTINEGNAQAEPAAKSGVASSGEKNGGTPARPNDQVTKASSSTAQGGPTLSEALANHPITLIVTAVAAVLLIAGVAALLYFARRPIDDDSILKLGPSFFFWLGMGYTGLLLLIAVAYNFIAPAGPSAMLIGGILPIAVPWFGALGAVTISLEGVFMWSKQWDEKFNYWHIGRPVFGAVLGIVAFFLFVLIITSSGSPPKFLDGAEKTAAKDYIIFYMVAFLVGYREETFRELIKRVTDLILKPGTQPPASPAVTFKLAGKTPSEIPFSHTAVGASAPLTVEVQNTGDAPLIAPSVAVAVMAPAPATTFTKIADRVTGGGDLAPGQTRTVDVTFAPSAAGAFSGTLSVTATNLSAAKTIRLTGTA